MAFVPEIKANWEIGVTVGVEGGMLLGRSNLIDVTEAPYSADNTGATDAAGAINSAITAAASGDVVFLPAGTYLIDSADISLKSNMTLRGEGEDTILLIGEGTGYRILANGSGNFDVGAIGVWVDISAGITQGSTEITVADTSALFIAVGDTLQISPENTTGDFDNPITVASGGGNYLRKHKARVVSFTSTTITFTPPIIADWSGLDCKAVTGTPKHHVGLESFTVDAIDSPETQHLVSLGVVQNSWMYQVRMKNSHHYTLNLTDSLFVEFRECYFDEQDHEGSNGWGFGVGASTGVLFWDNIILNSFPMVEVNNGTSGMVMAYNFMLSSISTTGIDTNHGPHNEFNLYEGNVIHNFLADGYFGSVSDDTIHRNWIRGNDGALTYALVLKRFTRNYIISGNILYYPDSGAENDGVGFGQPNIGNGDSTGTAPPWAEDFELTYAAGPGPSGYQELDEGVEASVTQIGNYDYATESVPVDQALGGDTLHDSLFLDAEPDWWPEGYEWPPFGPDVNPGRDPAFSHLPAGQRFLDSIPPVEPTINSPSTVTGFVGEPFSYQPTTDVEADSFIAEDLPSWATLNATTGEITGTPDDNDVYVITLNAINFVGTGSDFELTLTTRLSRTATITCLTEGVVTSAVEVGDFVISNSSNGSN